MRVVLLIPVLACMALLPAHVARAQVTVADSLWRWHAGDDPSWAAPDFDDSSWERVPFNTLPPEARGGVGWIRFSVRVDSASFGRVVGVSLMVIGAAEMYFNGQRFNFSYGRVGKSADEERGYFMNWEAQPHPVPVTSRRRDESGARTVVVAIRYSSFLLDLPLQTWLEPPPTLRFAVGEYNSMLEHFGARRRKAIMHQMFFVGSFSIFALVHFLLFVFYPRMRSNLYFAALMALAAAVVYLRFDLLFQNAAADFLVKLRLFDILGNFVVLLALRIIYLIVYNDLPKRFRVYTGLAVLFVLLSFQTFTSPLVFMYLFESIVLADMAVTLLMLWKSGRSPHMEGARIIVFGFVPIILALFWSALRMLRVVTPVLDFVDFPYTYYALLLLFTSVSVFLSRRFAHTSSELELQLTEVQRLAGENLRQERERVRLEAENERKQRELEQAREIQLSMLPETVPDVPGYDIAVYMSTATEVGGDYYDFHCQSPGSLTMVCGDATGHGMQAGIMVAASKGLFMTLACGEELTEMLRRTSLTIKEMGFSRMFMALALARLEGNTLTVTSAGMPFPLVYRAADGSVEELQLRGMPLGSFPDFPYQEVRIELQPGDVVLLMSDGLPEMFNPRDELFGDENTKQVLIRHAGHSAAQLVQALVEAGARWAEGRPQEDDVTFLVLKRRVEDA